MDQCTHEVRLQYWKDIISQCQNRPHGQSAKQWLKENGICEQTYYLWQRKIRRKSFAQMNASAQTLPVLQNGSEITFAEIPLPKQNPHASNICVEQTVNPVAILKTATMTVAVSADIPDSLLTSIIREVSHA